MVQIGAVKLDANSFARLDEFSCWSARASISQLSAYFQKLTGISQEARDA